MESCYTIAAAAAIMLQHVVILRVCTYSKLLGSPVYYLASHQTDAYKCSFFFLFDSKLLLGAASFGHGASVHKAVLADHWCNL